MTDKRHVIVIGAGASGMMAAAAAAGCGAAVDVFERNEKCGKKIYITGKGRCNLTNRCDRDAFLEHVCRNGRFLYSALQKFDSEDSIRFFEENGTKTKTERGSRVFPVSDHASDVTAALMRCMRERGVDLHLNTRVEGLMLADGAVRGVLLADGRAVEADAVIVATGGLSYPSTGSTGDGYRFAGSAGMKVTECLPSLVPMETEGEDARDMQGLSLRNVSVRLKDRKKTIYEGFGEMMFTHFGVTGPLILTASAAAGRTLAKTGTLSLLIDLKPALDEGQLDQRFLREFAEAPNRQIANVLSAVYPSKMIPVLLRRCGIAPDRPVNTVTREERRRLLTETKAFSMTVTGLRGYQEAVVTSGGVNVKGVRPDTMESKTVSGLYFAGEVLDVDAETGGFNLQIAWTTGYAAGTAAAAP